MGQLKQALHHLSKSIEYDRSNPDAHFVQAHVYSKLNRQKDAEESFGEVIKLDPEYPNVFRDRGGVFGRTSQFQKALADLNVAAEKNSQDKTIYYTRALVHCAMGDVSGFDRDIARYFDFDLNHRDVARARAGAGVCFFETGRYDESVKNYSAAIGLDPTVPYFYRYRAIANVALRDYEAALADFESAVHLAPESWRTWAEMSWLLSAAPSAAVRDAKRAENAARKSLSIKGSSYAESALANAMAEMGEFELAIQHQKSAMKDIGAMKFYNHEEMNKKLLSEYKSKKVYRFKEGERFYYK